MKKVLFVFLLLFAAAITVSGQYLYKSVQPEVNQAIDLTTNLNLKDIDETTVIYGSKGEKIGEYSGKRRYVIDVKSLNKKTIQAFLAAEDSGFYDHNGVSFTGVLRALWTNFKAGKTLQGASTITQQVARSFFLTREKTVERKLREMMLAILMEKRFSKDEILTLYLNKIYFGSGAYGIEAASQTYFRKASSELDTHEAALLAALPKAPSSLNPAKNPSKAIKRQKFVLRRMFEEGFLSIAEYEKARHILVKVFKTRPKKIISAPYFVSASIGSLKKYIDQKNLKSGLKIYTSLNKEAQKYLEQSLVNGQAFLTDLYKGDKDKFSKETSYAGITLDVKSGEVIALVGGKDFKESEFNRALETKRSMGDMIIPFLSILHLERGGNLYDSIGQRGLTYYDLLKNKGSYEMASLSSKFGYGSTYKLLRETGLKIKRNDMGLLLGQEKLSIFGLSHLFSTLSTEGKRPSKFGFVDKVLDQSGKEIVNFDNQRLGQSAFSKGAALVVKEALKTGDCVSSYVSGAGKTDDFFAAEFNDQFVSVKWFGSERGKVLMPKVSLEEENRFVAAVSSLKDQPCRKSNPENISYFSLGKDKNKKWIPFYIKPKSKNM